MPVKFHSEFNTGFNPNYLDFPGFDKNSVIERCVYAVKNNLHILTNFNSAQSLRKKHYDRLLENRRLILSNTLENYRDNLIESANEEHKHYLLLVKDKFINTTTNMV